MKIKRYFAADMRQAIRLVREAQGPDAVILSNRQVEGGVEVVAAVDYDEDQCWQQAAPEPADEVPRAGAAPRSEAPARPEAPPRNEGTRDGAPRSEAPRAPGPEWSQDPSIRALREEVVAMREMLQHQLSSIAWGEVGRRRPTRATLLRRLLQMDLSAELARTLVVEAGDDEELNTQWRRAMGHLARRLPVVDHDPLEQGGIFALVGPTGVGKTTTIAKLAARFALGHGPEEVGLITTDTFRVGAAEQLRTYGRIMGAPVRVARDGQELGRALEDLYSRRLVLIDTAGMGQRDSRLPEQLRRVGGELPMVQTLLVLAANTPLRGLDETIRAFQSAEAEACVLTKLDETTSLGHALSAVVGHHLPVAYLSDGQRVPEDIQPARARDLVTRAMAHLKHGGPPPGDESTELAYGGMAANGLL